MDYFVSVIVPVLNASELIDEFLAALNNQTYKMYAFEIVVVDNGSTDDTVARIEKYPDVHLFQTNKTGPYAARNLGIENAKGTILAFTDVNKIPDKNWIEAGVSLLIEKNADLAGGEITFDLGKKPSASNLYDSITFNNNRRFVLEERASATGNLFVKRSVFDQTGYFPENIRSGMDIWWTRQAVKKGFKLIYAEQAIVICKPRNFSEVFKKAYRVGKTHPFNLVYEGKSRFYILALILRTFAPPKIKPLKSLLDKIGSKEKILSVWCVAWASKICMAFGRLQGFFSLQKLAN